jgi:hypothetical protein
MQHVLRTEKREGAGDVSTDYLIRIYEKYWFYAYLLNELRLFR